MAMEPTAKYHAACEECRGRKLKCSGNRPQCDRCKKDQVTCEYSLQKRMGRPPKRKPRGPTYPERNPAPAVQLGNPYITPEPVQLRDIHYNSPPEHLPDWAQLFDDYGVRQMHSTETHNPAVYDLNWSPREDIQSNDSLDRHAYDLGSIHAPIPVAPIPPHLIGPHTCTPELHGHNPRIHISSSPDGSVGFDYPSPSFTAHNHILGHSPTLSPAPPVSIAGSSPGGTLNMGDALGGMSPQPSCDCIFNFFLSITLLKAHLTKSPIPFQSAISTSRAAIATATYSLSCPSSTCQNGGARNIFNNDMECISDMFLGALLPMLCIFYTKALESIEGTTGDRKVRIEGHEMDVELETWKEMARIAMVKEVSRVNRLVDEMGKLSVKKNNMLGGAFCYSADALWEPLCEKLSDMARNAKPGSMGRVFAENIGVC